MALTSMPYISIQECDANGNPYVGGKMFFYAAGTTTKQNTYADANRVSANTNPVILDAAGRATVFFDPLTYDVVLAPSTDTDPPVSPIWTRLGITSIPLSSADTDVSGIAGEALAAGDAVYLSDGSGGKTAGKWYKADADFTYASSLAPQVGMVQDAIGSGATGSIRLVGRITGLSGLTPGAQYFVAATAGAITSTAPTNARSVGTADSTTSLIVYSLPPIVTTIAPITITTTGTSAALAIPGGLGPIAIICNNATALTIQGIAAGVDGQILRFASKGAGQVNFVHQSGSATGPENRLINFCTTADTSLAAGVGTAEFMYDSTTARWRLMEHEQGDWINYTPVWGNTGTANTVGDATTSGRFYLRGRTIQVLMSFAFGSTSTAGSGAYLFTVPIAGILTGSASCGSGVINDVSVGEYSGMVGLYSTTQVAVFNTNAVSTGISALVPMTWVAGDNTQLNLAYQVG